MGYPFFAWVFAVPLFIVLEKKTVRERFWYGLFFGLASYFLLVSWLLPLSILGYVVFSFVLAMQAIIFCVFFRARNGLSLLYVPALWVFSEFIRTQLLGGFAWTLGYSQSFVPSILQIARLTGSYGISFIIIFINMCLYLMIQNNKELRKNNFPKCKFLYAGAGILLMVCVVAYGMFFVTELESDHDYLICSIQPNISSYEKQNSDFIDKVVDEHILLTYQCMEKEGVDLIVWPETAVTEDAIRDVQINQKIRDLARTIQTPLLIGSALLMDGKDFNSAVLFDKKGEARDVYHKRKLVPFVEYSPVSIGSQKYSFHVGKDVGLLELEDKRKHVWILGVVICSEDGYPRLFREMMNVVRPLFVAVLLNDAWFNRDILKTALFMHMQHSVLRAVEFGIPVLRGANTGVTCMIDARGRVFPKESELYSDMKKVFYFQMKDIKMTLTPYARFGDVFAVCCGVFFIVLGCGILIKEK